MMPSASVNALRASGAMAAPNSPRTLSEALNMFLRHASPLFLIFALLVSLIARFVVGEWSLWDAIVVAGVIGFWPIQEWLIHVFILHFKPISVFGVTIDFSIPITHRIHHRDPWDLKIAFIPVSGFIMSVPILFAFWFGLMPSLSLALTGLSIYLVMSINYEWTHFLVHTRYPPRSRYFRRLWRNHRLHHFKNEHYWYGVTMLGGDRLLGTAPRVGDVETSPTCRALSVQREP